MLTIFIVLESLMIANGLLAVAWACWAFRLTDVLFKSHYPFYPFKEKYPLRPWFSYSRRFRLRLVKSRVILDETQ